MTMQEEPDIDMRKRWPMNGWKENKVTPPEEVIMVRYDKLMQAIKEIRPAAVVTKDKPGTWWLDRFEELVNDLKGKP